MHRRAERGAGHSPPPTRAGRHSRRLRAAVAGGVVLAVALAFAIRLAAPWSTVFAGSSGVRLFDTDSYYHLRHARYAAAHFPHLQAWDPGIYPDGQPRRYAGLFDVAIAAGALVAGAGHPSEALLARAAAFMPAVLGTVAVGALFWLGALTLGRLGGLVALALLTLYPGTFVHRSLLGAVDHHVAEVVLAIFTGVGLSRSLRATRAAAAPASASSPPPSASSGWRGWLPDFAAAAPLAIFFFTWFGAPIYLVLVAVTYLGVGTVALARGDDTARIARAAFRYGSALLILLLAVRVVAPELVMEARYFKEALLATALFAAGLPAYFATLRAVARRSTSASPRRAGATTIVAVLGVVALAGLAVVGARVLPGAGQLGEELLGVKTNLVKEQAALSIGKVAFLGGAPAFIALAALPLAIAGAWRGRRAAELDVPRLAVLLFSTLIVLLWLRTRDYGYVAPPFLALLSADVLQRAWRRLRPGRARTASAVVVALALVIPVWPAGATSPIVPDRATLAEFMVLRPGWEQALAWMRDHTPPLAVPLDAPVRTAAKYRHPAGNYGVLAFWDFGHYVAELGRRPPVASGGISVSTARWFLLDDEDQAVRALSDRLRPGEAVRYCVVDAQTAGDYALSGIQMAGASVADFVEIFPSAALEGKRLMRYSARFSRSMSSRLYERDGDDLGHFRLVYASPDRTLLAYHAPRGDGLIVRNATRLTDDDDEARWRRALGDGKPLVLPDEVVYEGEIGPSVKIFEEVPGARLVGTAPAGAVVEARLTLLARSAATRVAYHRAVAADITGRFEVVVPYPTAPEGDDHSDVFAQGPYEVVVHDAAQPAEVRSIGQARVAASAVEAGLRVPVSQAGSP